MMTITGYHAHVYFDPMTRDVAERLRADLAARFPVQVSRLVDHPVGPHPRPMFQVAFAPGDLASVLPWLMLNRAGLAVLVHPNTGDPLADHESHPLWLGTPLPLDLDFVRGEIARHAAAG
jgi:DOPA 4,5-dioxygenase